MAAQFLLDTGVLDSDLLGPIIIVEASSNLGSISSSGTASVSHFVSANSSLGTLSANAQSAEIITAEGQATLGGIASNANSTITKFATALSTLGSLNASAVAASTITATAEANLGGLEANANTRPQTPSVASTGGGKVSFVQPYFPPKIEPTVEISTIIANATASLGLIKVSAMSEITFSILDDDAEVLLLI